MVWRDRSNGEGGKVREVGSLVDYESVIVASYLSLWGTYTHQLYPLVKIEGEYRTKTGIG